MVVLVQKRGSAEARNRPLLLRWSAPPPNSKDDAPNRLPSKRKDGRLLLRWMKGLYLIFVVASFIPDGVPIVSTYDNPTSVYLFLSLLLSSYQQDCHGLQWVMTYEGIV